MQLIFWRHSIDAEFRKLYFDIINGPMPRAKPVSYSKQDYTVVPLEAFSPWVRIPLSKIYRYAVANATSGKSHRSDIQGCPT
jgi:hypothetical protein